MYSTLLYIDLNQRNYELRRIVFSQATNSNGNREASHIENYISERISNSVIYNVFNENKNEIISINNI